MSIFELQDQLEAKIDALNKEIIAMSTSGLLTQRMLILNNEIVLLRARLKKARGR